jgi:hypothetical protein
LNVVLFAPFMVCFLSVTPENARLFLFGALAPLALAVVFYQSYGSMLGRFRYEKPVNAARKYDTIIGGTDFTPNAVQVRANENASEQQLLKMAAYNPDEVWTRESRVDVQSKIERMYYGFLLSSVLTVVMASLAAQTLVLEESPLESARKAIQASAA